jgi:hypothetical protein
MSVISIVYFNAWWGGLSIFTLRSGERLFDFRKDVIIIGAPFISLSSTVPRGRRGLTQYGQHRDGAKKDAVLIAGGTKFYASVDERSCIKIFCSITPLHTFDKALASSGGTSTPSVRVFI